MNNREKDLISVIVPVYNVEKYVERCIVSILCQTYNCLEVILVDDGSTDKSGEICDKYAKVDKRIKVIHKKNGGLSQARNWGLRESTGKFLMFVDSDDFLHLQMIECLYRTMMEHSADIALCKHLCFENTSEVEDRAITNSNIKVRDLSGMEACSMLYCSQMFAYFVVAWAKLYKADMWSDIYFPEGRIHEDNYTSFRLFLNARKVVFIEEPLYYYFQRADSIMKRKYSRQRFDDFGAFELQINVYTQHGLSDLCSKAVHRYLDMIFIHKKYIEQNRDKTLFKDLKKIYNNFKSRFLNDMFFTESEIIFYKAPWFSPRLLEVYWRYVALKKKIKGRTES